MRRPSILLTALLGPAVLAPTPPAAAAPGVCQRSDQVAISELVPNPEGSDADKEWVELYNRGGDTLDLSGWSLQWIKTSSVSTSSFPDGTRIADEGYLVLGEPDMVGGSPDVALPLDLGNGTDGDGLYLVDCEGTVVDAVVYGGSNDDAVPDESGEPATTWADKPGDGEAVARLSAAVDTDDSGADFCVTARVTPGTPNDCGGGDTGEPGDTGGPGDTGMELECPLSSDVLINELLPDPDGSDSGSEWVELFNTGDARIDLGGYSIEWDKGSSSGSAELPPGLNIAPGQYLLLAEEDVVDAPVDAVIGLDLGNGGGGDGVYLVSPDGCPADAVIYGDSNDDGITDESGAVAATWVDGPYSGESLARLVNGQDTNDSRADFASTAEPTPGEANPLIVPPTCKTGGAASVRINELMPDPAEVDDDEGEWVELYNAGQRSFRLDGWSLEGAKSVWSSQYVFPSEVAIAPGEYLVIGGAEVPEASYLASGLDLGNGSGGDGLRLVDCEGAVVDTVIYGGENSDGLVDDSGEEASSVAENPPSGSSIARRYDGEDSDRSGEDFWVTDQPTPAAANPDPPICSLAGVDSVKLNELLPNPAGSDDGLEWIELVNISGEALRLDGWMIEVGTSEWKGNIDFTFGAGAEIPAGGFVVIGGPDAEVIDYIAEGLSLGNGTDGDGVRLLDCEGGVVDTVIYSSSGLNDDGLEDDSLAAAATAAAMPGEDGSIGRYPDGADSGDHSADWAEYATPSPGERNPDPGADGNASAGPPGGCGGGCGADRPASPEGGGCATFPLSTGLPWLAVAAAAWRRRREDAELH